MRPIKQTFASTGVGEAFDLDTGNYQIEVRFAAQTENDPLATLHMQAGFYRNVDAVPTLNYASAQRADTGVAIVAGQADEEVAETVKLTARLRTGPKFRFSVVSTAAVTVTLSKVGG